MPGCEKTNRVASSRLLPASVTSTVLPALPPSGNTDVRSATGNWHQAGLESRQVTSQASVAGRPKCRTAADRNTGHRRGDIDIFPLRNSSRPERNAARPELQRDQTLRGVNEVASGEC